jgi:putative ABC transport system permease protein
MPIPVRYHLRSLLVRRTATGLTVLAVGFSVAILVLVLALARGFERSLADGGRTDNVVFLRKGATSEGESGIEREAARMLMARTEVDRFPDGRPMASGEMYAGVSLDKLGGGMTNVSIRGTSPEVLELRTYVRLAEGRMFRPGSEEVVVGRALAARVKGCRVGASVEYAGRLMPVVGILDAGGGAPDSEIWGDVEVLLQIFRRGGFSTVFARLRDPGALASLVLEIDDDPRLQAKAVSERDYFRQQAGPQSRFFRIMAYFLASIMAVGAVFGSTNTLLASLAGRSREIGTLLAVGYLPRHVLAGFLLEALVIGVLGGAVGVALAWPVNGVATGTTNWITFTEQAFSFSITPDVILQAVFFAGIVGVVGGVVPAARAAGMPPTEALRA